MLVKMLRWWGRVFSFTCGLCVGQKLLHFHGAASWSWAFTFFLWALVCYFAAFSIEDRGE
jgi:hypothetical protein